MKNEQNQTRINILDEFNKIKESYLLDLTYTPRIIESQNLYEDTTFDDPLFNCKCNYIYGSNNSITSIIYIEPDNSRHTILYYKSKKIKNTLFEISIIEFCPMFKTKPFIQKKIFIEKITGDYKGTIYRVKSSHTYNVYNNKINRTLNYKYNKTIKTKLEKIEEYTIIYHFSIIEKPIKQLINSVLKISNAMISTVEIFKNITAPLSIKKHIKTITTNLPNSYYKTSIPATSFSEFYWFREDAIIHSSLQQEILFIKMTNKLNEVIKNNYQQESSQL